MSYIDYLASCTLSRTNPRQLAARNFGSFVDRPARYFAEVRQSVPKFSESLYWNDVYLSDASPDLFYTVGAPMPGPRTKAFDAWYQLDTAGRRPLCPSDVEKQLPTLHDAPTSTRAVTRSFNAVTCTGYVGAVDDRPTVMFTTSDISAWVHNARRVGALHAVAFTAFVLEVANIDIRVLELETGYTDAYTLPSCHLEVAEHVRAFYEASANNAGWAKHCNRGELKL